MSPHPASDLKIFPGLWGILTNLLLASSIVAPLSAADRVVLIQSVWAEAAPHYAGVAGGRGSRSNYVVFKEGRHAPADEWLMQDQGEGIVTFKSLDPFYPNHFLNFIGEKIRLEFDFHAQPTILRFGRCPVKDDLWRLQELESGIFTIASVGKHSYGELLHHAASQDFRYIGLLLHPPPRFLPNHKFRIIDITPAHQPRE